MKYIASCSFGKDSLAMILRLIEESKPLDEVIFYDTGMEFNAIYDTRDKVKKLLEEKGIKFTELKPQNSFLYDMIERPVESKKKGKHSGYGWCGGNCRWGTTFKIEMLEKYKNNYNEEVCEYVGIAFDEQYRKKNKNYPLIEWEMTESDCLKYCYDRGYFWEEDGVRLYDVLDRVSCWCCANKNLKELKNIYQHLPKYWNKLKELQVKIDRPMKKYKNKKYGEYGNILIMENVFKKNNKEVR